MQLVRWDPFRELNAVRERMDRIFNDYGSTVRETGEEEPLHTSWVPSVDVWEDSNTIRLRAELPGLTSDDVELVVEDNRLIIRGEKTLRQDEGDGQYRRVEARYGAFYRSFPLPNVVNQESIDASFDNGVLEVTLPKLEAAKPKRIELKVQ